VSKADSALIIQRPRSVRWPDKRVMLCEHLRLFWLVLNLWSDTLFSCARYSVSHMSVCICQWFKRNVHVILSQTISSHVWTLYLDFGMSHFWYNQNISAVWSSVTSQTQATHSRSVYFNKDWSRLPTQMSEPTVKHALLCWVYFRKALHGVFVKNSSYVCKKLVKYETE